MTGIDVTREELEGAVKILLGAVVQLRIDALFSADPEYHLGLPRTAVEALRQECDEAELEAVSIVEVAVRSTS